MGLLLLVMMEMMLPEWEPPCTPGTSLGRGSGSPTTGCQGAPTCLPPAPRWFSLHAPFRSTNLAPAVSVMPALCCLACAIT